MRAVARARTKRWTIAAACGVLALLGIAAFVGRRAMEHDDDREEAEERDRARDHFWRARIVIVGRGSIKSVVPAFDCTSDGVTQRGACGPKLVTFKETAPPLLQATPAPGHRFDHWESMIRQADGATAPRPGAMPDGLFYLNGFGYSDTGALDTVTAVFTPAIDP
jgi:hypothetical protein